MALAYTAPTWEDGSGTGISASQLQAISNCIEGLVQGSDKAIHDIIIENGLITITYADGTIETSAVTGVKGVVSIEKTSTVGQVDTYTITYTDGSTDTFDITNGAVPSITANATADATSSENPTVTVTKGGTDTAPVFSFAFSGLKGTQGIPGADGDPGLGIKSVAINAQNHLIITYDDDTTEDAGLVSGGAALLSNLAPIFSESVSYQENDLVIYENQLYMFTENHPAGPWKSGAFVIPDYLSINVEDALNYREWKTNYDSNDFNVYTMTGVDAPTISVNLNKSTTPTENDSKPITSGAVYNALDKWTSTAQVDSNSQVTFTGLNDSYGYDLYCADKLLGISAMSKTGSGTSVSITYTVTGASSGDVCKLRILK